MKIKSSKHLFVITLAALITLTTAISSVMTGCGSNAESANATTSVEETVGTSIVTEIIEYTEKVTVDENENNSNESSGENSESGNSENNEKPENNQSNINSDKNESSSNNSDNKPSNNSNNNSNNKPNSNSNNNSNNNQNNNSNNNSNNKPNNNSNNKPNNNSGNNESNNTNNGSSNSSSKPSSNSKVLTVGGKKYNVGDTITCVYKVTAPENLENYEAVITYNSDYLEATSAVLGPVARNGAFCNHRLNGEVRMNGINISTGYDFKKGEELIKVTYLVKAGGKTDIKFNWKVATGFVTSGTGKAYVVDGKAVSGLKLSTVYS